MKTTTILTAPPAAVQDGEFLVGLGYIAAPIGTANWGVFHLLRDVIRHRLSGAEIQAQPVGVVQSYAIILEFTVANLAATLAALRPLLDELGNWRSGLAYYRKDSKRWHTVAGIVFDYDAALTDENINAACAEMDRHLKTHADLLEYCKQLQRDLESQIPEVKEGA